MVKHGRDGVLRIGALSVWRAALGSRCCQIGRLRVQVGRGVSVWWFYSPGCAHSVIAWRVIVDHWRGGASLVLSASLGKYERGFSLAVQVGPSVFMGWRAFSVELRALRSWARLFSIAV